MLQIISLNVNLHLRSKTEDDDGGPQEGGAGFIFKTMAKEEQWFLIIIIYLFIFKQSVSVSKWGQMAKRHHRKTSPPYGSVFHLCWKTHICSAQPCNRHETPPGGVFCRKVSKDKCFEDFFFLFQIWYASKRGIIFRRWKRIWTGKF